VKQVVLFQRQVTFDNITFQADHSYTFRIVSKRRVKWLVYKGKYLTTLSCFAVLFADQGYAKWVDDEDTKVA